MDPRKVKEPKEPKERKQPMRLVPLGAAVISQQVMSTAANNELDRKIAKAGRTKAHLQGQLIAAKGLNVAARANVEDALQMFDDMLQPQIERLRAVRKRHIGTTDEADEEARKRTKSIDEMIAKVEAKRASFHAEKVALFEGTSSSITSNQNEDEGAVEADDNNAAGAVEDAEADEDVAAGENAEEEEVFYSADEGEAAEDVAAEDDAGADKRGEVVGNVEAAKDKSDAK